MKNSLLFLSWLVFLFLQTVISDCQTVILSEDFSGFTTGTHSTPSTNDLSLSLDSKTSTAGWHGSLIYSAGGEIKIGTGSTTGWIETPSLDLSINGGNCRLSFEIARWPGDASTVQVYLDGTAIGSVISPTDSYSKIEIEIASGISSSKIRLQAVTKRFFLDNFKVTANLPTPVACLNYKENEITIWPVPSSGELHIENAAGYDQVNITDLLGRNRKIIMINNESYLIADISSLEPGLYLIIFRSANGNQVRRFVRR